MYVRGTADDSVLGDRSTTSAYHIYDTDRTISLFRHFSKCFHLFDFCAVDHILK